MKIQQLVKMKINFLNWAWKPSEIALASAHDCRASHKLKGII